MCSLHLILSHVVDTEDESGSWNNHADQKNLMDASTCVPYTVDIGIVAGVEDRNSQYSSRLQWSTWVPTHIDRSHCKLCT